MKRKLKELRRRGEIRRAKEEKDLNKRKDRGDLREERKKKMLKTTYRREERLLELALEFWECKK